MSTLGNYHHNFPHLAKQSGFYFQLHKGKVNWPEIESLDVNDIIENRNFQLLEQNLINVINCDLEKEYDLKILDRNFMKLFKLAQLGVDYLSYCEAYLDKCVVILQEQLVAFQEEYETLKCEKENKKEDYIRSKRKNKTQSYKCEKCDKAFISDVYLKFHDKRRHNIAQKAFDRNFITCTDNYQQTEAEGKSTTSTQTTAAIIRNDEDPVKIKMQHIEKIENLEQEIQHLKERLRKAERTLMEKTETPKSSGSFHSPFSGPMCHDTMLLLLPSYQVRSGNSYDGTNSTFLVSTSENHQSNGYSPAQVPVSPKTVTSTPPPENSHFLNTELGKTLEKKENGSPKAGTKFDAATPGGESFSELKRETNEHLEWDKENVDPTVSKLGKPLPPPRKSKRLIPKRPAKEDTATAEPSATPGRSMQQESESESLQSQAVMATSTPVMRKDSADTFESSRENVSDKNKRGSTSNESLYSRKGALAEDASTSFFRMIVRKNSPKFRKFGQNLRRSLSNLRDSVSSTERDLTKESVDQGAKTSVVNGLNHRLRQLGVDPEWTGIPKKTMKQKLKVLKHRRKFLVKENPMYPFIRQNIEEKIVERLKKSLGSRETDSVRIQSEKCVGAGEPGVQDPATDYETRGAKPQNCVMYDIESDSGSNTSDSEIIFDEHAEQSGSQKAVELGSEPDPERLISGTDFDLTVFQVGRKSFTKMPQKDVCVKVEECHTESDTDGDPVDENKSGASDNFLSDKRKNEVVENSNDGYPFTEQRKSENQSILKGPNGLQSGLQLNGKKKVWFVSNSDVEEGLSDSPSEDNLWSLKSDWERNVG